MIVITSEPLTQERQEKIRAWLAAPESQWVEEIINGQIAELIAQGGNAAMAIPIGTILSRDVPGETKEKMAAAAILQIFLTALATLRQQNTFSNTSLKIE